MIVVRLTDREGTVLRWMERVFFSSIFAHAVIGINA